MDETPVVGREQDKRLAIAVPLSQRAASYEDAVGPRADRVGNQ
jgi:hypothetical protein